MTWNPEWTTIQGSGAGTMEHTVRGLQNSTAYTFEVRAVNSLGDGAASNQATAYPPGRVPSAPRNLTALEDNRQVTLSWLLPAQFGGWPIIRWEYRWSTDGGLNWRRDWTEIPGGDSILAGISDLPAPDGPFIHLKAAQRTKRLFVTASSRFRGRQLSAGGRASH